MAFMDFLKEFGVGGFAGLSGNVGDMLTLAGAVEDFKSSDSSLSQEERDKHTKHSDNLAISSGAVGLLTNGLGLVDNFSNKETGKLTKGLGAAENVFGLLYGVANIIGGAAGRSGNKGLQKGMGIGGGVINILGGLAGIGKSFSNFSDLKEKGKTGEAWKSLIVGGLGGLGKIFSGVTGAGAAANPNSRGWKGVNVGAASFGGLIGLADTGINIGMAANKATHENSEDGTEPAAVNSPNQVAEPEPSVSSGPPAGGAEAQAVQAAQEARVVLSDDQEGRDPFVLSDGHIPEDQAAD